jgi:ABC-type multidrug transport system fused ATPase/permease subunit
MISDLTKLIKIIKYSKLKKINLLFLLIFLNSVIEILSIGILLPIVGLIVNPEFYDSFQKFFFERLNFDFFQVNNLSKKNFSLILIIFAIFLYFIKFLINAVYSWVLQSTKTNYENFIGTTILNNLTRTSSLDFLSLPASKLLNDMNQRISMVSNSIVYISNIGVEIIILCIVSFILLYKYPLLTFIILILFLSISLILYYSWKKKIFNWSKQRGVAGEKRNRNLLDYFNGIREVLLYSSNNLFLIEFIKLNKKYLGSQKKILFLNSLPRIFLELIFIFSALGIIYYYVLNDLDYNKILFSLSFGLIIVIRLLPSVNRLISNINYFKFSSDSIFHVYKLLQMTISTDKDIKKITFEKKLHFQI